MDKGGSPGSGTRTVLFTDVVGSTALRSRLGDVAADEVRRDHDELLQRLVGAHAGTVVKGLGDGLMAVFESAASAAACAVAMQQALERRARRGGGEALSIRIGLAAGDVAWEQGDYFGTPVVEAARLEAAAGGGQILAADLVRLLAGSRAEVTFHPVGSLTLQGLPEPVAACEVPWEPLVVGPVPLPAGLVAAQRLPFVGREAELERLEELWRRAASGERQIAFLAGEPGIGKTRLAGELAGSARVNAARVLYGRCDEDLGVPYQPFVEALRQFVEPIGNDAIHPPLGRFPGELTRVSFLTSRTGSPTSRHAHRHRTPRQGVTGSSTPWRSGSPPPRERTGVAGPRRSALGHEAHSPAAAAHHQLGGALAAACARHLPRHRERSG